MPPRKPKKKSYLSAGPVVEAFLETSIVQTRGEWGGEPLKLDQWQRDILLEAFLIDPDTGLRVYRTVVLGLPAKNGKSQIASGLALYGLLLDNVNGELEPGAQVYAAANSADQARIVFNEAKLSARQSPVLSSRLDIQEHRIFVPGRLGTIMRPLSSDGKNIHGVMPSFAVVDELGSAKDGSILTILQKSRTTRRQPMTWIISHVGNERYGPLGEMYDRAIAHKDLQVFGKKKGEPLLMMVKDRENGFLFIWYGLQDGYDPEDPETWEKCNPASWQTRAKLHEQRNDLSLSWTEFQRYHLNAWVAADDEFLPPGAFVACGDDELVIPRGAAVWLGVDAAKKDDNGSIAICSPVLKPDGSYDFRLVAHILDHPAGADTMLERLEMLIRKLARRYDIREVHFDPHMFVRSADMLASEGFEMVEFPQSHSRMAPATGLFRELVLGGRLKHDNDPELVKHVGQAVVTETERGERVDKKKARNKIDGCVASLMAVQAAQNAIARGDYGRMQGVQFVPLG